MPSYYCMADEIATSRPAQGERVEITTGRRSRAVITSHPAKGVRVEILVLRLWNYYFIIEALANSIIECFIPAFRQRLVLMQIPRI